MAVNTRTDRLSRADDLQSDVRVLSSLVKELAVRAGSTAAVPVDEWLRKVTPDQLLDRWQELRGEKAEAFLLHRIYRRRAAQCVRDRG